MHAYHCIHEYSYVHIHNKQTLTITGLRQSLHHHQMAPHTCIGNALGDVDPYVDLHEGRGVRSRPHDLQQGEEGVPVGGRVDVSGVRLE